MGKSSKGIGFGVLALALMAVALLPALAIAKSKPGTLPPDTSKAGTCDFIAQPDNTRATPAEQQLVSNFFDGAIQQSDCGGGPCFSIGFSGP